MSDVEHMEPPFEAYAGEEPYLFASYSHKDAALVYPELERLHRSGVRVWYDEGIDPGNEWPEEVAKALDGSSFFLVFISARSVESKNVKNEINFAINHQKPLVAVHVEATELPKGLELRMGDIQAILKWRMNAERFQRQMEKTIPNSLMRVPPRAATERIVSLPESPPMAAAPKVGFFQRVMGGMRQGTAREEVGRKAQPQAGDALAVDLGQGIALDLVWCPPGSFMMGSPENELGRSDDELLHRVTLTKGFWIGKFPVTQGQWETLMGGNPSNFKAVGKDAPVENVSWDDCQGFLAKLHPLAARAVPNAQARLPTEAEWEYACRAGTGTALNSGKNLTSAEGECANMDAVGWYGKNSGTSTHPAGQKAPNAWGIFDMHGDVWEWCTDWYGAYSNGDATDPAGPSSGSGRVLRGGSWNRNARDCRSASRGDVVPGSRYIRFGFRVVVALR